MPRKAGMERSDLLAVATTLVARARPALGKSAALGLHHGKAGTQLNRLQLHRTGDLDAHVEEGRYIAERIRPHLVARIETGDGEVAKRIGGRCRARESVCAGRAAGGSRT